MLLPFIDKNRGDTNEDNESIVHCKGCHYNFYAKHWLKNNERCPSCGVFWSKYYSKSLRKTLKDYADNYERPDVIENILGGNN